MDQQLERVVVTGIGMVSPCGVGLEQTWASLLAGKSGIGPISMFDASAFHVRIGGEVRDWDPSEFIEKKKRKELDRFSEFALVAAKMAVADAQLELSDQEREHAACVVGVGMGGVNTIERINETIHERGPSRVSPYSIPSLVPNLAAGQIAIHFGLQGMCMCTATACASGASAIGEAFELIRSGRAPLALAGGAEAAIAPISIAGFQAMYALSRRNDEPTRASRPFDRGRDGFVCSEGSAILVLEPLARAQARGAHIYAELTGYGHSCDAYHPVQPPPGGKGACASMRMALRRSGLAPEQIAYINAHGTSTLQGDVQECQAIRTVFGAHAEEKKLWVSSTKSMTGHMLGAAGAVEAAITALVCERGKVPPTINIEDQDPDCALDVVANEARERQVQHALSNSFGFGGSNVSLVFSRPL